MRRQVLASKIDVKINGREFNRSTSSGSTQVTLSRWCTARSDSRKGAPGTWYLPFSATTSAYRGLRSAGEDSLRQGQMDCAVAREITRWTAPKSESHPRPKSAGELAVCKRSEILRAER